MAAGIDAATIPVSTCTPAAINAAVTSASDGDIVMLTCTGSVSWSSPINIPSTKGVSVVVQNGTNTPKTSPNFPLIVTMASGVQAFVVTIGANHSPVRISGFRFAPNPAVDVDGFIEITGAGNGNAGIGAFRVDNNYFDTVSCYNGCVRVAAGLSGPTGQLWGLIDNNTFHNCYRGGDTAYGPYVIQVWNYWHPAAPSGNQCWGCNGWTDNDFVYGSEHQVFIEDNLFEQTANASFHMRHYISAELGGRYVSRHNTFTNNFPDQNADLHDAHGLCSVDSNGVGSRGGEIYANTITGTGYDRGTQLRGGSWLVYDNVVTPGGGNPIEFNEYRAQASSASECATTNNLALMPPWPVPMGASWGANDPWRSDVSTDVNNPGTYHPLPQQIFNTYTWNNKTPGGTLINPVVPVDGALTHYIIPGTDYFASPSKPAALASYTAYTYPHPLQSMGTSSAPNPPTGLMVTVK